MSEQQNIPVGQVEVKAGDQTAPEYNFAASLGTKCAVTELFAEWSPPTGDEDIKAFLYSRERKVGLPPSPNYRMFYGPKAGSTCPLMMIFDVQNPRMRFTIAEFDPIKDPMPIFSADAQFQIVLRGTPITAKGDVGLRFSIRTRPLNF